MSLLIQTTAALTVAVFLMYSTSAHVLKPNIAATPIYLANGVAVEEPRLSRERRFVKGDQPKINSPNDQNKKQGWELNPNLQRNDQGTVRGDVSVQNHGKNHDFEATWGQNLKGPGKHSEQWSVGGRYRW